jgi:hypothetical protein
MCLFRNRLGGLAVDVGDAKRVTDWNNLFIEQPEEVVDFVPWIISFAKTAAFNDLSEAAYA